MPCIEIENLTHVYFAGTPLKTTALRNVTLVVEQGEFLVLAGSTGSGKSTLVRHFNGLLTPTTGLVRVLGGDVANHRYRRELWRQVGLVFQFPERQIFSPTVYEDIAFGPRNTGLAGAALEERVAWAAAAVELPGHLLQTDPAELSGGMRRRAAIAGMLAMRPKILVLDEPGAGLEPAVRKRILGRVKALQAEQGMTVVLITHHLEDAALYASRTALLREGTLVAAGNTSEILGRSELLHEAGLEPTFASVLAALLAERGIKLPRVPITLEEAAELLAPLLGTCGVKPGGGSC